MYKEMEFLFDKNNKLHLNNKDNKDDIYNKVYNKDETGERTVVYKHSSNIGTDKIKNYIKTKVYSNENTDENDYIRLLSEFNDSKPALKLKAADFAYLKKLGVYPINKLMILRRFPDGVYVPNNLASWKNPLEPISTIVGWVKDGNEEMFSIDFNESWVTSKEMLHELFGSILENEFGGFGKGIKNTLYAPGWSQGILFGFLKSANVASEEYDFNNIPVGDPNVLQEAAMREGGMGGADGWNYTLISGIKVNFETEYEQKYIGDIDPGNAMLDLINNVIRMGTSDVKYILKNSNLMSSIMQAVNAKGSEQTTEWLNVINAFLGQITKGLTNLLDAASAPAADGEKKALIDKITFITDAILTSTIAKYKLPLNASVGVMTGVNTAPWHLTIGNPYSPILTVGNVVLTNTTIKMNNSIGFNDMPTGFKVDIELKLGRNLGGQEIFRMFNNTYFRYYKNSTENLSAVNSVKKEKGNEIDDNEKLAEKIQNEKIQVPFNYDSPQESLNYGASYL